jgi:hypothetical protein
MAVEEAEELLLQKKILNFALLMKLATSIPEDSFAVREETVTDQSLQIL